VSKSEKTGTRAAAATCKENVLSVPGPEKLGKFNDWVAFGTEHHTLELYKASDDTLAVRSVRGGYGLAFLVIPAAESKASWFRYVRADNP